MSKRVISTDGAPAAIGPYSQAIEAPAGRTVYCSGQIPLDPATGELVMDSVAAQTDRVIKNLKAVVEAAGGGLGHIVKTTIFLTDLADYAVVNEVYGTHFGDDRPARAAVQVSALPKGVSVEIEAIAVVP